ncbi:MAG: hypothetical protein AB1767_04065 [Bacillota bacterium]
MKKITCYLLVMLFCAGLLVGCGSNGGDDSLSFDFDLHDGDGWEGGFTDLPVNYETDNYELFFGPAPLPAELGSAKKGLMLQGHNRSDDLFMFISRQLGKADGLKPDTVYLVEIVVDFVTNVPAGLMGIGGSPGEALFVKVGAAGEKPAAVAVGEGDQAYYQLSVDKGAQSEAGRYTRVVGDIAKEGSSEDDENYIMKSLDNKGDAIEVTTDSSGNLWIFVGTDSGFEGRTTLYYTAVQVTLTAKA